ncbi:MAG: AmmeMemoRadiSam system protein B [Planctomycetota bacterium]|jgi:AmmeMemoRadiSam system protein B
MTTCTPSVAGTFYPSAPDELEHMVRVFLDDAPAKAFARAIIGPHAGYIYSGPIAGSAYRAVDPATRRVILLGPAHFYPLSGIATHSADRFSTPLGEVPVDVAARDRLDATLDAAFVREHSLETHLPFLQMALGEFEVVPILVGDCTAEEARAAIETAGIDDGTLIAVSSDLSHFLDYETARERDGHTAESIVALDHASVGPYDACGCRAVAGLLEVARARGWSAHTLDLRNSGDTAGDRNRVVGYGAFSFA